MAIPSGLTGPYFSVTISAHGEGAKGLGNIRGKMMRAKGCRYVVVALGAIFIIVAFYGDSINPTGNPGFGPTQAAVTIVGVALVIFRTRVCDFIGRFLPRPTNRE